MTRADNGDNGPIRVIIIDDQDIVRDGLVTVLALLDGIEVLGDGNNGQRAVELVADLDPDVVLMDLRMPVMDGAEATAVITRDHPQTAVLVLTTFDDDTSIARALRAGARGYLTKDASRDDIAAALRSVARGQSTFDASVSARLISGLGGQPTTSDRPPVPDDHRAVDDHGTSIADPAAVDPAQPDGLAQLTPRERDVLGLIGEGLNNTEISDRLFVSTATVKTHINNLFAKLGLRDRAQAVRLANRPR